MHVGAVAHGNEVAGARVLASSLQRFHPDWKLTVLVLPGLRPELEPGREPFRTLTPADLAGPDLDRILAAAPPRPLSALMRPLLVARLLDEGAESVLLLAPDAELFGPLEELAALLGDHDAVFVPRVGGSLPADDKLPDGRDLLEAGEIDDQVVAVRASERGRALVDWWTERTREAAEEAATLRVSSGDELPRRLGASPLAAAVQVFERVASLRDSGYAASYWNLHERRLSRDGDNGLRAAGRPLRLMRFAGFRPDRPWWLSEHATRTLVLDDPILSELCGRRARALKEAGWVDEAAYRDQQRELPNGLRLDERLLRLRAEAYDAGERFSDVYSIQGADEYAAWLREPAPHGAAHGINRYAYDVWRERIDVQEAYPELDDADGEGFVGWLWIHGRPEMRLQAALLPPAPASVEGQERRVPAVLVIGYLRGNLGLGEAARGYVSVLQAAGVPVATHSIRPDPPVDRLPRGARQRPDERSFDDLELGNGREPEINLLCVNADQVPELVAAVGDPHLSSRYTIGHWAWETDYIPERWDAAFDLVDEVWVNSSYVAEHIGRAADVPVVVVPTPIEVPDPAGARVPFALPDGFLFLFVFDFFSTLQRKNPIGLVEAFKRAFEQGEGPTLVLKTINADFRPEARERLRWSIGSRQDILLVDTTLAPPELAALFVRADCYASLHRSEGYGLTLAEAMVLGKPVVATGFSGNTDFMTPANSYLVDWQPTDVGHDAEHYPPEGTWAEPSIEHAAVLLREVWEDQEEARRRGARAALDVGASLSPTAIGAIARARLVRIVARRDRPPDPDAQWTLEHLDSRLGFDLAGRGGLSGPRGVARRAVFRAIRPYAAREREFDEAVATALRRVHLELQAAHAARDRDRDRIARLERRLADLAAEG